MVYAITDVSDAVLDLENEKSHLRGVKNRMVREVSNRENQLEAVSRRTLAIRLSSNRVRSSGFCKLKLYQKSTAVSLLI